MILQKKNETKFHFTSSDLLLTSIAPCYVHQEVILSRNVKLTLKAKKKKKILNSNREKFFRRSTLPSSFLSSRLKIPLIPCRNFPPPSSKLGASPSGHTAKKTSRVSLVCTMRQTLQTRHTSDGPRDFLVPPPPPYTWSICIFGNLNILVNGVISDHRWSLPRQKKWTRESMMCLGINASWVTCGYFWGTTHREGVSPTRGRRAGRGVLRIDLSVLQRGREKER